MNRLSLTLLCVLLAPVVAFGALPGFMLERMGTMRGQIFVEGEPLPNAVVAFFFSEKGLPPMPGGALRVPEFLSRLNNEGRFSVGLAAGTYYLGILIRDAAEGPGPPRPGEKYFFAVDEQGELRTLKIASREELDMGRIDASLPQKFAGLELGNAPQMAKDSQSFQVQGTVADKNGLPFPGAIVMAKQDLNTPRPEFISNRTGSDGTFSMMLPAEKKFFLIARQTLAGARPKPGQLIGTYGIESETGLASPVMFGAGGPPPGVLDENKSAGNLAQTVTGSKDAKVTGITIHMYAIPDPDEMKASIQGTPGSPKFETGAILNHILFAYNTHQLEAGSYAELDRWVEFLRGKQGINVELSGHTDNRGTETYNLKLSTSRARTVAEYLSSKGVDRDRVTVKGYGESQPIADNNTEEGRSKNRRVEIKFQ